MLRKTLFATVALPLIGLANAASAQTELSDERTAPVVTGTINAGNPDDIVILAGASVLVGPGQTAVTIDSNNTVVNQGTIGSTDADNTTGILITGGTTSSFTNSSIISLTEDFTATDDDQDGDIDGPIAIGTGRTGILVAGPSAFTGDITNGSSGSIIVEGNNSAGIRILSGLDGNLVADGTLTVIGANSYGVQVSGGAINGDVEIGGAIRTVGENTVGVDISADINGAVSNTGTIVSTGFRSPSRPTSLEARDNLDADDLTIGGPAVAISANISGGFNNGRATSETTDPDTGEIITTVLSTGQITLQGSAPALLVSADNPGGDIVLGAVGDIAGISEFGIVNDGNITSNGINDGFATNAVRIQGAEVGGVMQRAIIENGIRNTGRITADAFSASATGLSIGDGGVVDTISNVGLIGSTVLSQTGGQSNAIALDAGADVNSVVNTGLLESSFLGSGADGQAVVIYDEAGVIDLIDNEGTISATFTEVLPEGETSTLDNGLRRTIAIDVSANTTGVAVIQNQNTDFLDIVPAINGDILLGSGNDTVEINAGTVTGDIVFGDGEDVLIIDNGAALSGAIFDSDGLLALDVRDGMATIGADTALNLTEATFGENALLRFSFTRTDAGIIGATFNATGAVTFADGATIAPVLTNLVGESGSFSFLNAGSLNFGGTFEDLLSTDNLPYLYNVDLRQNDNGTTLFLDLERRSASELGLDANQSAAFEPWFAALEASANEELETAFVQITSAEGFQTAFEQVLPEYGEAALQFTLANTDGTTGAIATRLDNLRRGYGAQGGIWLQEIGYYLGRTSSSISQPYRGFGLGLALGIDKPFGPFDAVGIALSGFANEITQSVGFDNPLNSQSIQFNVYSGAKRGGFSFESNSAIGFDSYNSERVLQLSNISRTASGSRNGYHISGTSRLSYDLKLGSWFVRPAASLDYLNLRENGYIETGGGAGFDLDIDARTSKSLSGSGTVTFGRRFIRKNGSWWSPRLRAGLRSEFSGSVANTVARFSGFTDEFTLTPEQLPNTALLLGFSLTAGSRFSSFGFDYDADIRDGFMRHTGRLVIRFIF